MSLRRRSVTSLAIGVLLGSIGFAACGGDDDTVRSGSPPRESTTTTRGGNAMAGDYVGLSKRGAIAKADAADVTWRITREDDERFPVTLDFNPERLNFEIDNGEVTSATYG